MVRRSPDGPPGSDAGGEAEEAGHVAAPDASAGLPPFAEVFVPQFENILTVLDRLSGFALVPIEVPSRDVAWELGQWLSLKGHRTHIVFDDRQWRALAAEIASAPPGASGITLVINPRETTREIRTALHLLNQRRDTVATRLGAPLLWCGDAEFLRITGELAPDFWSVRELALRIDVPYAFRGSSGPWELRIDNPNWQLPLVPRTNREVYARQYPRERLFLDPNPERLRSDARFFLDTAQVADADSRIVEVALDILRASGDGLDLALGLERAAALAQERGETAECETKLQEAHAIFKKLGSSAGAGRTAANLAHIQFKLGRPAEAEDHLREALALARELDDWDAEGIVLMRLAIIQYGKGQLPEARLSTHAARRRFEQAHDEEAVAVTHYLLASILRASADLEGAIREIRQAVRIQEQIGKLAAATPYLITEGQIQRARGNFSEALAALRRAADLLRDPSSVPTLVKIAEMVGSLPANTDPERQAFLADLEGRIAALRDANGA